MCFKKHSKITSRCGLLGDPLKYHIELGYGQIWAGMDKMVTREQYPKTYIQAQVTPIKYQLTGHGHM